MKISSDHVIGALSVTARVPVRTPFFSLPYPVLPTRRKQNCNGRSARLTLKKPRYPQDV